MLLFSKLKHLLLKVLLIILLINITNGLQEASSTTAPPTQTHWQRPVSHTNRNTVTRWKTVGF